MENQNNLNLLNTGCWVNALEGLKYTFQDWIKEAVENVITEKMCNVNLEDKRLTTEELCERWNISKNTLYNYEKDGRITHLPIGGRKKIFSMKDVLDAEADGLIRNIC